MKLRYSIEGLKPYAKDFLVKDLAFYSENMKFNLLKDLEGLRSDRNLLNKMTRLLNKWGVDNGVKVTVDSLLTNMEISSSINVLKYDVDVGGVGDDVVLTVEVPEYIFAIQEAVSGVLPGFAQKWGRASRRKRWRDGFEKSLSKTYTSRFSCEVLEK